ncbi:MAG: UDP-N-acetylmuramoyl-L-alanyl-D-glutamate--2,6-diaminopimelate ligase [Chloroflexota bacterium]|jgi:UDP-N-acetylmuramoyl-L-alanyl-D-glutamate--2,6-diaminopimelate ligase|nr:UDP-N-acetylmuramoyl-L-alanyl-D-glutamate--2,6-diaminopimelate ligase [Chloroflexota bacterium]
MTEKTTISLKACLSGMADSVLHSFSDAQITGIAWDSREVQPGDVFFAMVGGSNDGHRFIDDAVEKGAAAVIGTQPKGSLSVPYVRIQGDDREALAKFSAAFYDYPSKKMTVIGITGTDGKTTTTNLVYHILRTAGFKVGMISTVNALIGGETLDTGFHVTTPASPDVQRYLALMVEAGLTHAVLEVTSHGLAQKRVAEVDFDLAAVTNITHEHLDYHGDYQGYLQAKGRLFTALSLGKTKKGVEKLAVLNKDDESYPYLSTLTPVTRLSYSLSRDADLWADEIENLPNELRFKVHSSKENFSIRTPLIGHYNVHNSLAAIGLTYIGLDIPVSALQTTFETVPPVPGRMERIDLGQDFLAIVDFAHTPNAIQQALLTARELTDGKVIAVFGSAGLRDVEKRKLMPEIAVRLADECILTAEDPRTESLDAILADMKQGAEKGGGKEGVDFWLEPDRPDAIRKAVERARKGDLVITCGKGHEQSMCFGQVEYAWDDRTALRAALAEHLGIPGPDMPELPISKQ